MCGIVGFVGKKEASPILVEGLSKLEYRGYDSAGVAVLKDGEIKVRKYKGRLKNLEDNLNKSPLSGEIGIWLPAAGLPLLYAGEMLDGRILPLFPLCGAAP